ncbi:hypothetical protein GCM10023116_15050 [Kistimonas scapharcae]|uniref:NlpC/P60 domain-containing protein n=1 Tax=Kistimonas scapharcae TaxID=1036133 RepID=A0ABP8V0A4_9GAMM
MDWLYDYLGRPWINGEQDCWWLVREVYRNRLDIELPALGVNADSIREVRQVFRDHPVLSLWQAVDKPTHLDLVFFSSGRIHPTHVALFLDIDGGRYLHTYKHKGCVCETLPSAEQHGWKHPQYYRHVDRLTCAA